MSRHRNRLGVVRFDCPVCDKRIMARPGSPRSREQRLRGHLAGAHGIELPGDRERVPEQVRAKQQHPFPPAG